MGTGELGSGRRESYADHLDRRLAWAFPAAIGLPLVYVAGTLLGGYHMWVKLTTIGSWAEQGPLFLAEWGSVIAVFGIFTAARPMIRLGGYRRMVRFLRRPPSKVDTRAGSEFARDVYAAQVWAVALAGVGTLMNGFSGTLGPMLAHVFP